VPRALNPRSEARPRERAVPLFRIRLQPGSGAVADPLPLGAIPHDSAADHRLAFSIESKNTWHRGVADVRPESGSEVWGALWLIDEEHSEPLDRQEGLFRDPPAYRRIQVALETANGDLVTCRSYEVADTHLPSPAYLETMLRGARAIGLPDHYVATLEAIEHNGFEGGGPG
jgi:gamma-glutamylcyclotransferase (GGCT)/AIG2-like uncharacterized protein YtfP